MNTELADKFELTYWVPSIPVTYMDTYDFANYGTSLDEIIVGNDFNNNIYGGEGDDIIYPRLGINLASGQSGTDTVVFALPTSEYYYETSITGAVTVKWWGGSTLVSATVEKVVFDGQLFDFGELSSILSADNTENSWFYGYEYSYGWHWEIGWHYGWHLGWIQNYLHYGWNVGWQYGWNLGWAYDSFIGAWTVGWAVSWYFGWGVSWHYAAWGYGWGVGWSNGWFIDCGWNQAWSWYHGWHLVG